MCLGGLKEPSFD